MVLYIGLCLVIVLMAFGLAGIVKRPFEAVLPAGIFINIFILYISGLFGLLPIGAVTVIGVSVILFLISWSRGFLNRTMKDIFKNCFTFGFLVFIAAAVLIYFMTEGRLLSKFDEFTHWGLTIKNFCIFDGYANVAGSTTHGAGYQPGVSLFSYFFTVFAKGVNESFMLRGENILLISLLLPLFKKIRWKHFVFGIILIPMMMFIPWLFNGDISFFNTLYVDGVMAVAFGSVLYQYMTEEQTAFNYVSLGLGCGFICLIKPGSEAYALMILGIAFIDVLFFRRKDFADLFRNGARWIAVPFSVVFTAASYVSWKLFTASNNMLQVFDYVTVTDEQSASAETIAAHFWQAVTAPRTGSIIPLSYIWWIAILAGLGLLAVVFAKGAKASVRAVIYTVLTIAGYAGYGAVLLFMYIYLFTPVEGASLASLDRYMCTYLLGAVIFLVYMIADNIIERFESVGKLFLLIPVMLVLAVAPLGKALDSYINFQNEIDKTVGKRQIYSEVATIPEKLDYTKDRVYFIAQDTNGYEYQVSYYLATPVPLSYDFEMGWSLGTPYSEQDVWTLNFTPAQWEEKLIEGRYTYVYLFRPDLKFKSTYRSLFENPDDIADNTCFSITVEKGRVLLKKAF